MLWWAYMRGNSHIAERLYSCQVILCEPGLATPSGLPVASQRVERAEQSCAAQPCHAFRSQSTSSKNNAPATGFALYGAMGLKPGDLSSAAASFIDGSESNLILAYTSPGRSS